MSDWLFPLPIFPEGALASSVITTVWIGVFVAVFFNLRLGWVLSGLVVPGYLVPILIVQPWSFVVILVQASLAYLIARIFSEWLSGPGTWSALFGRDRFVVILIASVIVRLGFDGWILPPLALELDARFGIAVDWQTNLHSFGLVVMALLANQLWKPGYLRGMGHALAMIGITYIIVRYGLMELTNFRISGIYYLYEDFASSILATPKAYIILIVTVLIASQMNLRYGWDFAGVLIPALIALQWYQPLKVLMSFVEAFAILGIALAVLRLPIFANASIEGGRKLLLFFNISFALRFILGHIFYWGGIEAITTDYFGFGYLLATLVAIKMHEKGSALRIASATLQVSVAGALLGSAIGFALTGWLTPQSPEGIAATDRPDEGPRLVASAAQVAAGASLQAYAHWRPAPFEAASPAGMGSLREAARLLLSEQPTPQDIEEASAHLSDAGFDMSRTEEGLLAVTQRSRSRLGGRFLIDPEARTNLLISVPHPTAAPGLPQAALTLMRETGARAIAFGGSGNILPETRSPDLRLMDGTYFQAFHEGSWGGIVSLTADFSGIQAPLLRVPAQVPAGLDLRGVEAMIGSFDTAFGRAAQRSLQETAALDGYAKVALAPNQVFRLAQGADFGREASGRIQANLLAPAAGDERDRAAYSIAEMLYLDREILTPMVRDVPPAWADPERHGHAREVLSSITQSARAIGYDMLVEDDSDDPYVLLRAGTGSLALRLGLHDSGHIIHAPDPGRGRALLHAGVALFHEMDALAIVADASRSAALSGDGQAIDDPDLPRRTGFAELALQILLRETGHDILLAQVRGAPAVTRSDFASGLAVAFDTIAPLDRRGPLDAALLQAAGALAEVVQVVAGQGETAGFEINALRQLRQAEAAPGTSFAAVWLSPAAQSAFAERRRSPAEETIFARLGIETREIPLDEVVRQVPFLPEHPALEPVRASVAHYLERRDVAALHKARRDFPDLAFERVVDPRNGQSFLVIGEGSGVIAVAHLQTQDPAREVRLHPGEELLAIGRFLDGQAAWLIGGDG